MRQADLLEPADLTLLHRGKTFTIQLPNGQPFDLVGPRTGTTERRQRSRPPSEAKEEKARRGLCGGRWLGTTATRGTRAQSTRCEASGAPAPTAKARI